MFLLFYVNPSALSLGFTQARAQVAQVPAQAPALTPLQRAQWFGELQEITTNSGNQARFDELVRLITTTKNIGLPQLTYSRIPTMLTNYMTDSNNASRLVGNLQASIAHLRANGQDAPALRADLEVFQRRVHRTNIMHSLAVEELINRR